MPELEMPEITLEAEGGGRFRIAARWPVPGIAPLLIGALRAMADDYGALVTSWNWRGSRTGTERCASGVRCRFQRGQGVLARAGGENERAGRFRGIAGCRGSRGWTGSCRCTF
jgi:hypothetical protein